MVKMLKLKSKIPWNYSLGFYKISSFPIQLPNRDSYWHKNRN